MSRFFLLCSLTLLVSVSLSAADAPPRLGVVVETGAFDPSQGVPVKSVVAGSTAAALGVQVGDLIATLNGTATRTDQDIATALSALTAGQAITLEVRRGGDLRTLTGSLLTAPTSANLLQELGEVRGQVNQLKAEVGARTREPTLAELLRELQILQEQFPRAAAEFKKLYPKGEFSIVIRITSDATAEEPVDLLRLQDAVPTDPAQPVDPKKKP